MISRRQIIEGQQEQSVAARNPQTSRGNKQSISSANTSKTSGKPTNRVHSPSRPSGRIRASSRHQLSEIEIDELDDEFEFCRVDDELNDDSRFRRRFIDDFEDEEGEHAQREHFQYSAKLAPRSSPVKQQAMKQSRPSSQMSANHNILGEHHFRSIASVTTTSVSRPRAGSQPKSGARALGKHQELADDDDDYRNFDPYSVYGEEDEEEDVWYSEERLFEDHIQEIIDKWQAIDDEIWAKIICMERNRRIAKAYARKHTIEVNGSEDEYLDGTTLGLNSFENPDRDSKTCHIKQYIGQGIRIKITKAGDILVKRLSKANVFVHRLDHSATSSDRIQNPNSSCDFYALNSDLGDLYGAIGRGKTAKARVGLGPKDSRKKSTDVKQKQPQGHANSSGVSSASCSSGGSGGPQSGLRYSQFEAIKQTSSVAKGIKSIALDYNKAVKIFDMNKFKVILERESRKPCPNRKRLQGQCISIISFVLEDNKMLNLPSWIMIINIVAIDLLKTEIGLIDPHDLLGPMNCNLQASEFSNDVEARDSSCVMLHQGSRSDNNNLDRRFKGYSAHNQDTAQVNMFLCDKKQGFYNISRPHLTKQNSSRSKLDDSINIIDSQKIGGRKNGSSNQQLAAAKRAFANAAAIGAYSSDHYRENFANSSLFTENNRLDGKRNNGPNNAANNKVTGSSSSGFNSHCSSSQNDSSAASSSSNIAAEATDSANETSPIPPVKSSSALQVLVEATSKLLRTSSDMGVDAMKKQQVNTYPPAESQSDESISALPNDSKLTIPSGEMPATSRGKRPPKLPHRVQAEVSQPIPIPAPPTSTGAGPSGKANLILVSPTGLSPPLPKRKGMVAGEVAATSTGARASDESLSSGLGEVPEFETIKHIDENGQCNILKEAKQRLPAGIPAHAQLAPPATQRHILRYLMMATREKRGAQLNPRSKAEANFGNQRLSEAAFAQAQVHARATAAAAAAMAAATARYRRPLPILPCQSQLKASDRLAPLAGQSADESLYYCGLQARVPTRAKNPHQQPEHRNALGELRHQNRDQMAHKRQPYAVNQTPLATPSRPFLKFFKSAAASESKRQIVGAAVSTDSLTTKTKDMGAFLSVDNLDQSGKSAEVSAGELQAATTSSIFAGLLKRSKGKKVASSGLESGDRPRAIVSGDPEASI